MSKFEIAINKQGEKALVKIGGVIDEDADFGPHSTAGASQLEIDFDSVKSINSCGIREWIKWVGSSGATQVQYKNCPKIIVDQINMVQGFLPAGGQVMSFYVPYFNEDSGEEKSVLLKNGEHFTEAGVTSLPAVKDSKGAEMEMDVVEAKYFKFLKK